jgi:hypothetical protein
VVAHVTAAVLVLEVLEQVRGFLFLVHTQLPLELVAQVAQILVLLLLGRRVLILLSLPLRLLAVGMVVVLTL